MSRRPAKFFLFRLGGGVWPPGGPGGPLGGPGGRHQVDQVDGTRWTRWTPSGGPGGWCATSKTHSPRVLALVVALARARRLQAQLCKWQGARHCRIHTTRGTAAPTNTAGVGFMVYSGWRPSCVPPLVAAGPARATRHARGVPADAQRACWLHTQPGLTLRHPRWAAVAGVGKPRRPGGCPVSTVRAARGGGHARGSLAGATAPACRAPRVLPFAAVPARRARRHAGWGGGVHHVQDVAPQLAPTSRSAVSYSPPRHTFQVQCVLDMVDTPSPARR